MEPESEIVRLQMLDRHKHWSERLSMLLLQFDEIVGSKQLSRSSRRQQEVFLFADRPTRNHWLYAIAAATRLLGGLFWTQL